MDLLKEVESDDRTRQILLDEGTLLGISESLREMRMLELGSSTDCQRKNDSDHSAMSNIMKGDDIQARGHCFVRDEMLSVLDYCITSTITIIKSLY